MEFFRTSTSNQLAAEKDAGVGHHVAVSIVGADRLPDSGYLRAKVAQEELVESGPVPYTIVRSTQFFEFVGRIADEATDGDVVRLSPGLMQPIAADDLATAVGRVAVGTPVNGVVEVAGPERIAMDELIRRGLRAKDDEREVIGDPDARYFGATLETDELTPGPGARLGETRFEDWLAAHAPAGR